MLVKIPAIDRGVNQHLFLMCQSRFVFIVGFKTLLGIADSQLVIQDVVDHRLACCIIVTLFGDIKYFEPGIFLFEIPFILSESVHRHGQLVYRAGQEYGSLLGVPVTRAAPAFGGPQTVFVLAPGQDGFLDIEFGSRGPIQDIAPGMHARLFYIGFGIDFDAHIVARYGRAHVKKAAAGGTCRQHPGKRHEFSGTGVVGVPQVVFEIAGIAVTRIEALIKTLPGFTCGIVIRHIVHTGGVVDHQEYVGVRALG
jgi:hypothetical protein